MAFVAVADEKKSLVLRPVLVHEEKSLVLRNVVGPDVVGPQGEAEAART